MYHGGGGERFERFFLGGTHMICKRWGGTGNRKLISRGDHENITEP